MTFPIEQGGRCLDQSYLDRSGAERDHSPGGAHAVHEHANTRDNIGDKEIAKSGRAQRPPEAQRRSSRCVSPGAARRSMAMFLPLSGNPFADQLNTESATWATCSRAFRSDLRRAIALIP